MPLERSLEFRVVTHGRRIVVIEELLHRLGELGIVVGDVTIGEEAATAGDGGDESQKLRPGRNGGGNEHRRRVGRRAGHVHAVERQDMEVKMQGERT